MAFDLDDQPACLVVDLRMPGRSGLELQQLLLDRGLEMSIVFISGGADVESGVRAMKGGAIDFLEKPFSDETLLAAVVAGARRGPLAPRRRCRASAPALAARDAHAARARRVRPDRDRAAEQASGCPARNDGEDGQGAPLARDAEDGRGLARRARAHVRQAAAAGRSLAGPGHGSTANGIGARAGVRLVRSARADGVQHALVHRPPDPRPAGDADQARARPERHPGRAPAGAGVRRLLHAARDPDGPHRGPRHRGACSWPWACCAGA